MKSEMAITASDVSGMFSHMPVSPSCHSMPKKAMGSISALAVDSIEAESDLFIAVKKLCAAKPNQRVRNVIENSLIANSAIADSSADGDDKNSVEISSGSAKMSAAAGSDIAAPAINIYVVSFFTLVRYLAP